MTTNEKTPSPAITSRACTCRFKNDWGSPVSNVTVHHWNSKEANNCHTWPSVRQGETTGNDLTINYETGVGSPFDYWQVCFTAGSISYQSKGDFYCNLTSTDDGGVVTASIQSSGFQIVPPESSPCHTGLEPSQSKRE